jgi:hydroxymethylpyrimidine pyrophosphatase-like HAD family hydrolase
MTAPEFLAGTKPGVRLPSTPPLALLLDVDGPVASPVTRDVKPDIIADLVALATAGIPVVFNTGRSDAFIREQVMAPMIAAGMPAGTVIHAICEKGAVWFSYTAAGPGPIHVDHELAVPKAYGDDVRRLVAEDYSRHMFFDETKRAMVSVEQHIEVTSADYLAEQKLFDSDAMDLMTRHGMGVVRLEHHAPNSDDEVDYRVDPTIISTDIESVRLGKDLGASRAVELLAAQSITPQAWRTVGDSRTDYAMADWLHHNDHPVKHIDVRPADGIPVKPYDVLTATDLGLRDDVIHDDAGGAFLRSWREALVS